MAIGDITGNLASLSFSSDATYPHIIHIAGSIYAIVYEGSGNDGWLRTVSISDDGLTLSTIASLEFNPSTGLYPNILHISGNIYVIVYEGAGNDGWLTTVSISDDGVTLSTIASLEFDTAYGRFANIIHVSGIIYAIAYYKYGNVWIRTVSISNDGVTLSNVTSLSFGTAVASPPKILHVSGNVYVIVYGGADNDGWLKTISISNDGLSLTNIASLEWDTTYGTYPSCIHIADTIYAIAYNGPDDDGWLRTVSISPHGFTLSNVASYEFDTVKGWHPDIIHVANEVYSIAYNGPDDDGWLKTVSISDNGLTLSTVSSYEFDPIGALYLDSIHIVDDVFAIVYLGSGIPGPGWLKTVGITASEDLAAAHQRFTGGMLHRAVH